MIWTFFVVAVLAISGAIGMHLARFREVYTEMTGMMAGMTMGMLNGFVLGFAWAAATASMFWGNLFGILMGLALGVYFGRPGGLMGVMDGGMGGVMGGSMGAMLAVMLAFPSAALYWTALLLGILYLVGMAGLVVMIEQSAPGHAALHRLAPFFTRAVSIEVSEAHAQGVATPLRIASGGRSGPRDADNSDSSGSAGKQRKLVDYYALLGASRAASHDDITEAYLDAMEDVAGVDERQSERLERALAVLTDPQRRQAYDRKLAQSETGTVPLVPSPASSVSAANSHGTSLAAAAQIPIRHSTPVSASTSSVEVASPNRSKSTENKGDNARGDSHPKGGVAGSPGGKAMQGAGGSGASPSANGANGSKAPARSKAGKVGGTHGTRKQGSGGRQATGSQQQVRYARQMQSERQGSPMRAGVLVVGLLAVFAVGWWAFSLSRSNVAGDTLSVPNSQSVAQSRQQAQLEAQAVTVPVGADGKQTVSIVLLADKFQYNPKVIKVKQGVPVHFDLSVTGGDPG